MRKHTRTTPALFILFGLLFQVVAFTAGARAQAVSSSRSEYLWYEAENMRGVSTDARNEPRLAPWWQ
ncbi:MAG TPA: hypothetical protein VFS10_08740, partial [Pyrinomonadaceae bacterium]|nr:hypothetical protein [Pyrinomonadaceae bacterium]